MRLITSATSASANTSKPRLRHFCSAGFLPTLFGYTAHQSPKREAEGCAESFCSCFCSVGVGVSAGGAGLSVFVGLSSDFCRTDRLWPLGRFSRSHSRLYSRRSAAPRIALYLAWLIRHQPPSISSTRRPSSSLVRLYGSGDRKANRAASTSCSVTLARRASPGTAPYTLPLASAMASIVTHTIRVLYDSPHTVDSVMLLNSLV